MEEWILVTSPIIPRSLLFFYPNFRQIAHCMRKNTLTYKDARECQFVSDSKVMTANLGQGTRKGNALEWDGSPDYHLKQTT